MPLPAVREKIASLPRSLKVLLPILFILVLIIVAEGSYYLWSSREKAEESKYIDADVAYQEGVFLYDKATKEPMAIRGRVTKIEGRFLTIENQGQQALVELDSEFEYSEINEEPRQELGKSPELEYNKSEIKDEGMAIQAMKTAALERGLLTSSEHLIIDNLNKVVSIGDFVVVSKLGFNESGTMKGVSLSILSFSGQ